MRSRANVVLPPSRLKEKRRKSRVFVVVGIGLALLLLIGGAVGVLYLPAVQIDEITIEGVEGSAYAEIERTIREELRTKMFAVIPRNNVLLYSDKAITAAVVAAFPNLSQVDLQLRNLHALHLKVEERNAFALWCKDDNGENCFLLDENGFIYEQAPVYSGTAYVRFYGPLASAEIVGNVFLGKDEFRALLQFVEALKAKNHIVEAVHIDQQRDVRVTCAGGYDILFTRDQKPEEILAKIQAAEGSSVLEGKKLSELYYLDLRFGNRLYYKLK